MFELHSVDNTNISITAKSVKYHLFSYLFYVLQTINELQC